MSKLHDDVYDQVISSVIYALECKLQEQKNITLKWTANYAQTWLNAAVQMQWDRNKYRALAEDLKLAAECFLTAVADMSQGTTSDNHPDWNAVQYLAGEASAAIQRANHLLGDGNDDDGTAVMGVG